jgi:hypothetical protein
VVRGENWKDAASRVLLLLVLLRLTEAVIDHHVVVVNATLHLLLTAAGQKAEGS